MPPALLVEPVTIIPLILVTPAIVTLARGVRTVPQGEVWTIER